MIQGYRDRRSAAFATKEYVPAFQGFEGARRLSIAARSGCLRGNRLEVLRGDRAG